MPVGHPRRRFALLFAAMASVMPLACSKSKAAAPTCAFEVRAAAPVTDHGSSKATGTVVTVAAANAAFTPTCVTGVRRGELALRVRNTGKSLHNVKITDQGIDVDVAPGHTVTVRVAIGSEPVVYTCKYHRALGMVGILIPADPR